MPIKLIIGLGNPGARYANTYHNAGLLFVQYFEKHREKLTSGYPTSHFTLLTSTVFMNESGSFVAAALRKRRLKPADLILVHDDSDIALGAYKLSFGRGAAGHKGAADVIRALGTNQFSRLRIGVRRDRRQGKAERFVLERIAAEDRAALVSAFSAAAAAVAQGNGAAATRRG